MPGRQGRSGPYFKPWIEQKRWYRSGILKYVSPKARSLFWGVGADVNANGEAWPSAERATRGADMCRTDYYPKMRELCTAGIFTALGRTRTESNAPGPVKYRLNPFDEAKATAFMATTLTWKAQKAAKRKRAKNKERCRDSTTSLEGEEMSRKQGGDVEPTATQRVLREKEEIEEGTDPPLNISQEPEDPNRERAPPSPALAGSLEGLGDPERAAKLIQVIEALRQVRGSSWLKCGAEMHERGIPWDIITEAANIITAGNLEMGI